MSNIELYTKKLISVLKLNGIIIRSEFSSLIINALVENRISLDTNFESCVKIICENLEKHIEINRSIERSHIDRAIEACIQSGADDRETIFNIINAFDFPKLQFNVTRKLYFPDANKSKFLSGAEKKCEMFVDRYRNVLQRTKRSIIIKNDTLDIDDQISLHTVDYLLTVSQRTLQNHLILGALFLGSHNKYYVEDATGMVQLDLTHANYHGGFFYEGCFILVNGFYTDKILQVSTMILPPGEEYKDSKVSFGNLNYFGGHSESLLRDSIKLRELQNHNKAEMIVFISDLWLDKLIVFEKLELLFQGLSAIPPIAFVFMGNFLSQCYASESLTMLKRLFKQLADLIHKFDSLKQSHFVFVPGLNDPSMMHILPRMPLPDALTVDFKRQIPKSIFTTNPSRLQYCNREVVLYRNDILSKFMQESLNKPAKNKIDDFITKTIISQGHLSPFSLNVQPVHWSFDYSLHLYPLPNLVVIGDKTNKYAGTYRGCTVINPGSFIESGFAFKTYLPFSDEVQDCGL